MERIQKVLDSFVDRGMAVGTSVLVYRDGEEAFFGSAGKLRQGEVAPFARDTIMLMYSMTKVVTAVAVMTLMDKGAFTPDTPVYELIPDYRHLKVLRPDGTLAPASRPLTVEHLLTMTSGIPYPGPSVPTWPYFQQVMAGHKPHSTLDMVKMLAACPLCFDPGEHWMYGLSADVLGGIIVAVTGLELGEYMKKTIFDPLGMKDSHFFVPEEKQSRVAGLYNVSPEGMFTTRIERFSTFADDALQAVEMGGAGLYSTLDDFMRFGEMLRKGGEGIVSAEMVSRMAENHLNRRHMDDFWETNRGYGYGWLVRTMMRPEMNRFGPESKGSFGWNGMAGTTLRIDPARRLTAVYGIQRVPSEHDSFIPPLLDAINEVWPVEI